MSGASRVRQHQDADRRVGAIAHLVGAVLAPWKAHDVALLQVLLTLGRPERGLPAHHDEPLLVRVVDVIRPKAVTRLELVQAAADQLGVQSSAHPRVPAAPTLALFDPVPVVAVEGEDVHGREPRR